MASVFGGVRSLAARLINKVFGAGSPALSNQAHNSNQQNARVKAETFKLFADRPSAMNRRHRRAYGSIYRGRNKHAGSKLAGKAARHMLCGLFSRVGRRLEIIERAIKLHGPLAMKLPHMQQLRNRFVTYRGVRS